VPPDVNADQIRSIFQNYGAIADLNIMAPRKPGAMGGLMTSPLQLLRRFW